MPQYHFDVFDGRTASGDEFGDVFVDADEAIDQAAGLLMDMAQEVVLKDGVGDLGVVVRDEQGVDLYWAALMFRDSRIDPSRSRHLRTGAPPPDAQPPICADPVQGSRQARAAVDEAWRQFLDTLADVSRTIGETRTLMELQRAEAEAAGPR